MLESFLKILNGDEVDEIVWTADLCYWIDGQPEETVMENGWDTETGYLRLCNELGSMPYFWYGKFWAGELQGDTVEINSDIRKSSRHRSWRTPVGTLREIMDFAKESHSWSITKHAVENEADLKILLYILENNHFIPANLNDYPERMALWREYDGLPPIGMLRSPLSAFLLEWAGVENGIYLLMDQSDLVEHILQLLEKDEGVIIDALCELQPPLVHFPDNLTSEIFAGFFEQYMAERYKKRLKRLHAAGIKCAVHLDGTVRGLLPKLVKSGIDAIEALTPQPIGDVAVEEMREIADSDGVILWGGVPGAMFSHPFQWREMEQHIVKTVQCWEGKPFILSVADQVPPDGDITMVRKISDLIMDCK